MAQGGSGPTGVTQGQPKWGIGKSAQHLRAFPPSIYGVDLVLVGCLSAQPPNPPSFIIGASTSQVETPLREAKAPAYRQFFSFEALFSACIR